MSSFKVLGPPYKKKISDSPTLVPLIVVYTRLLFFGKNFRGSTFIRVYMFITWDRIFTLYMFIRDYIFITLDRILNLLSHNITKVDFAGPFFNAFS